MNPNPPITIKLENGVSCRLYEDTRPHHLEISPLQKGLVLLIDDKEVIEEGAGFATPVVMYGNKPFFSGSAKTRYGPEENRLTILKTFMIDTISRKKFRKQLYLNERLYTFLQRRFHNIYTKKKSFIPFLTLVIGLVKTLGVNTEFQKVKPKGTILMRYSFRPNIIDVEVSLSDLNKEGCKEILLLNEQGASFFRKYSDTDGSTLLDGQIGPWETTKAKEVMLSNVNGTTGFFMENKENTTLFRGREKIQKRYSWVGFCYAVQPQFSTFRYTIKLMTKAYRG